MGSSEYSAIEGLVDTLEPHGPELVFAESRLQAWIGTVARLEGKSLFDVVRQVLGLAGGLRKRGSAAAASRLLAACEPLVERLTRLAQAQARKQTGNLEAKKIEVRRMWEKERRATDKQNPAALGKPRRTTGVSLRSK